MTQPSERPSVYGLDEANVLLLTVDCCRADTFAQADLPFMKSLGSQGTAQTAGMFTLPAHMSMYGGYLPIDQSSREPYYNPNIRQLWRLRSGRDRDLSTVGLRLDGNNVVEGYKNLGYHTVGIGGVRWFRNAMLQQPFDEFQFYGPDDQTSVFAERKHTDLALNHTDEILDRLAGHDRSFLLVNCLETHVPYDTGNEELSEEAKEIMTRGQEIWGCKTPSFDEVRVSKEELESLRILQVAALETIDPKVEALVRNLAKPLLLIITGDHGECFGEDMLWGHGYPHPKVTEVPIVISVLEE